jgi:hypothetical protein
MRRVLASLIFFCLVPAFAVAGGSHAGPAIPSWFWGCWRIVRALYPREAGAPAGGLSQSQIDSLIGTHVVLQKGCCSRTARTGLGYAEGGETILAGPAFRASVVSRREFWHFWYFPPSAIGIRGRTVTMVEAQLPAQLSDLDFLATTVYLRPADHSIVLDVEGAQLLAEKLPLGAPGCACDAPAEGRSYSIVGRTPPPLGGGGPGCPTGCATGSRPSGVARTPRAPPRSWPRCRTGRARESRSISPRCCA